VFRGRKRKNNCAVYKKRIKKRFWVSWIVIREAMNTGKTLHIAVRNVIFLSARRVLVLIGFMP
jgi:hypothetical protein